MAMINHEEGARQQRINDAFSGLLKFLETKNGKKNLDTIGIKAYFDDLQEERINNNKKIEEYQNFFNTLSSFLPRSSSTSRKLF